MLIVLFVLLVGRPLLLGKSVKEMIVFMFEGTILTARKEYDEVKEECEIQIEYNNLLSERIRRIKTIKQLVND